MIQLSTRASIWRGTTLVLYPEVTINPLMGDLKQLEDILLFRCSVSNVTHLSAIYGRTRYRFCRYLLVRVIQKEIFDQLSPAADSLITGSLPYFTQSMHLFTCVSYYITTVKLKCQLGV
jgi:hypothetical protein